MFFSYLYSIISYQTHVQVDGLIFSPRPALLQQRVGEEVQASVSDLCGRLKELDYQEEAVSALTSFLKQDLERYRDLERPPDIRPCPPSMHGKSGMDHENNTVPSSPSSTET